MFATSRRGSFSFFFLNDIMFVNPCVIDLIPDIMPDDSLLVSLLWLDFGPLPSGEFDFARNDTPIPENRLAMDVLVVPAMFCEGTDAH